MFSLNAVQVIIFNKVKHKSVHGLKLSWQLYEMKYFQVISHVNMKFASGNSETVSKTSDADSILTWLIIR
jgi:hypothetical protein